MSDIVDGVVNAIYRPSAYEIINIGGANTIDVKRLIELIETALGVKASVRYGEIMPGDVPITYADVTKAKKLLGFSPKVRIEEGVQRYVKWFLERRSRLERA